MKSAEDILSRSNLDYPNIWDLAKGTNPNLLRSYLEWLQSDEDRFLGAVEGMQWYPPGFHGLLIAIKKSPNDRTHQASLQLNFYHPDFPGDEEPHAHSRDARSSWYAQPGTNQVLTRYQVVANEAPRFKGLNIEERVLVANNIGDAGDGQRPRYMPLSLGSALILKRSETFVAPLGSQDFSSTEVHHAGFKGNGVAISVHYKGPEEAEGLNTHDGYIYYKGLSTEAAGNLMDVRSNLVQELKVSDDNTAVRLAPATMLYPEFDAVDALLNREDIPKPKAVTAEMLLCGGLQTVSRLSKIA
jgi:hypothetical protein